MCYGVCRMVLVRKREADISPVLLKLNKIMEGGGERVVAKRFLKRIITERKKTATVLQGVWVVIGLWGTH